MAAPTSPIPSSLAEGSDPHEPFTPGALGLNTPAKRAQTVSDLRDLDQEDGHAHPRRDGPRVGLYLYKILNDIVNINILLQ